MDKGYEGASMSDIAAAAGLRKASLYAHFKGKESIFEAIFEDILTEYVAYIEVLTAPRNGEDAITGLERMFTAFIRYCHNNLKMYFWDRYFYYPPVFLKDYIQQKTQETQDVFLAGITRCIQRGIADGEIRPQPAGGAALAYYYLMIGLSMSVKLYDPETLERDTASAWEGLRTGLVNKP